MTTDRRSLVRESHPVRSVTFIPTGGDIGYIRSVRFQTTDQRRTEEGPRDNRNNPPEKLAGYIVDLRNNPGGLLG